MLTNEFKQTFYYKMYVIGVAWSFEMSDSYIQKRELHNLLVSN